MILENQWNASPLKLETQKSKILQLDHFISLLLCDLKRNASTYTRSRGVKEIIVLTPGMPWPLAITRSLLIWHLNEILSASLSYLLHQRSTQAHSRTFSSLLPSSWKQLGPLRLNKHDLSLLLILNAFFILFPVRGLMLFFFVFKWLLFIPEQNRFNFFVAIRPLVSIIVDRIWAQCPLTG